MISYTLFFAFVAFAVLLQFVYMRHAFKIGVLKGYCATIDPDEPLCAKAVVIINELRAQAGYGPLEKDKDRCCRVHS